MREMFFHPPKMKMAAVLWIAASFFLLLGSTAAGPPSEDNLGRRPVILVEGDSIEIENGGTLNLTCRDRQKVVWILEDNFMYDRYEETHDEGHELPYITNLVIENVNYTNVGNYLCAHNTTENKNKQKMLLFNDPNVSSVYVYVRDLNNLLAVNSGVMILSAEIDQNYTFPCKPSFPDVEVTLDKIQGDYDYDPKLGFTSMITGDEHELHCTGKFGGEESFSLIIVTIEPKGSSTEIVDKPRVEVEEYWQKDLIKEEEEHIVYYNVEQGSSVNLTCYTKNEFPKSRRRLVWEIPSTVTNNSGTHLTHRYPTNEKEERVHLIINADPSTDSGEYSCYAKNLANAQSERNTIYINVLPIDHKFVQLASEEAGSEIDAGEDSVKWLIMYTAYDDPSFILRRGSDILLNSSYPEFGDKKYILQTEDFKVGSFFVEIKNPDEHDIGTYTLEGHIMENGIIVANDSIQINFTMPVDPAIPDIVFYVDGQENIKGIVKYQQDFKIICESLGYPKPTLTLEFKEEGHSEFHVIARNHGNQSRTDSSIINKIEWEGHTSAQGTYRCSAHNEKSEEKTEKLLFISDDDNGKIFGIEASVNSKRRKNLKSVVEGDHVTLRCRGNKLAAKKPFEWKVNGVPITSWNTSTTHGLTEEDTDFSYVSVVHIEGILSDVEQLIFGCSNGENSENYIVSVKTMKAPQWLTEGEPLVDHSLYERGNLFMECPATGVPEPVIRWYKGDVLLNQSDAKHLIINGSVISFDYLKISDSGVYRCEATNRNATIFSEATITVSDPSNNFPTHGTIITVVVLSSILIILCICLCVKIYKDKKRAYFIRLEEQQNFLQGNPESLNPELGLDEQAELLPYDNKYEVPRDSIIFDKLLGAGAFGRVYRCTVRNLVPGKPETTVAVKMMKSRTDSAQLKALRSEVKIMIHIGRHVNIVNLLGACSKELASKGELLLLVEYCKYGNILDYMRRHRKDFVNQINEYDRIDPSITEARMRQRSGSGSRSRTSRGLKYAHLSFNQDMVGYTPGQGIEGELSNHTLWVEPTTPTGSVGNNGHLPNTFYSRSMSASDTNHVASDMSTMTFESSSGASDGYLGAKSLSTNPVILNSKLLLCWAFQIAKGMEYLAFKKVLHGDLAARNILLTDDFIIKISDFGLAKDIYKDAYQKKSKTPLPWKWLAVECFRDGVFSIQSDIWSYGVVLWEIFTLGQSPYPGLEYDNSFVTKLEKGVRLEQPRYATYDLYRIMLQCWGIEPMERPSFSALESALGTMLGEAEKQHYLELNEPYQMENTTSTFVNFLQSPDYAAKIRDRSANVDQDGYEMPFSPSPCGAMAMPFIPEAVGSPRLTPLQMNYMLDADGRRIDGAMSTYVPMHSPTKSTGTAFSFEKDVLDSISKRDSEIQEIERMQNNNNNNDDVDAGIREEYLPMQASPNSDKSPHSPNYILQYNVKPTLRNTVLRSISNIEKHDSGLYSPTANMQSNPQYMIMDSFPKVDDNNYLSKENVDMSSNMQHSYINLNDKLPSSKFSRDYLNDVICNEEYDNLLPKTECRGRTISETSSGLGSISEESPPENRNKPDSLKSSVMESVIEESLCV